MSDLIPSWGIKRREPDLSVRRIQIDVNLWYSCVVAEHIADGVIEVDTLLGGWEHLTAGFVITGDAPVLIETGSQSSLDAVLRELESIGLGPGDLAGVAVTHIHLDHAGAVGDIAKAFPNATVYVHPVGARHLVDPTRLVSSASMVYGDLLDDLYGRLEPTQAERIKVLEDNEKIPVSPNRYLEAIDSPGHAKHHLGYFDSNTGIVFSGDAVGVLIPEIGVLRPATPPPDFDLEQVLDSLDKFSLYSPTGIAMAHYGLFSNPDELLANARDVVSRWAKVAEDAFNNDQDIESALEAEFRSETDGRDQELVERFDTLNGMHANANGLRRWMEKRRQGNDAHTH